MQSTRPARSRQRHRMTRLQPYRILVASNGAPGALGALRVAVLLARRTSAMVNALTVATPFPHRMPTVVNVAPAPLIDDEARREALESLRSQLAEVRGARGWAMRAAVGFSADTIVDAAARWPSSLVIVGLGRHGFLERLVRSDTAVTVARRSTVPVLAVPANATGLPVHALAAIDFTEASVEAAILAGSLLGPNGDVTLLHTSMLFADEPRNGIGPYEIASRERLLAVEERVRRASRRRVSSRLVHGTITDELERAASHDECDLIALGGRRPSMIERMVTGSVRAHVMHRVNCAVLVVPSRGP